MSNDKVVRPDGYYLAREFKDGTLEVVKVINDDSRVVAVFSVGTDYEASINIFHWIAEEPLDLECIKLLQMNGGLQNAVDLVNKDASVDKDNL